MNEKLISKKEYLLTNISGKLKKSNIDKNIASGKKPKMFPKKIKNEVMNVTKGIL